MFYQNFFILFKHKQDFAQLYNKVKSSEKCNKHLKLCSIYALIWLNAWCIRYIKLINEHFYH
jgi:hypothetical protein